MSVFLKLFGWLILSVNVWFCFGELFEQCNDIKLSDPWNVSFDLSRYMLKSDSNEKEYYCVKDIYADVNDGRQYSYCFNICGSVLSYPYSDEWTNTAYCKDLKGQYCEANAYINASDGNSCDSLKNISGNVWAYQIWDDNRDSNKAEDHCWQLSNSNGGPPEVDYIDDADPTAGVELIYKNGGYCDQWGKNREFHIQFLCENSRFTIPDEESVNENECVYTVVFKSIYGCPKKCGGGCSEMCNGHGLCGYDFSNVNAKCFCYAGFSGTDCENAATNDVVPSQKQHPNPEDSAVKTFTKTVPLKDSNGDELEDAKVNITFDLIPFKLDSGKTYIIEDDRNYTYYFNIATEATAPASCKNLTGPCEEEETDCSKNNDTFSGIGYAYQYKMKTDECYLLGSGYGYSLYDDENDYARGIKLTYSDGGYCESVKKNRVFEITFLCPDTYRGYHWNKIYNKNDAIEFNTTVTEETNCEYNITIENSLACPYQCITEDPFDPTTFTICGGQGRCAADPYAGFVRCICDDGYTGDDCQTVITTTTTQVPLTLEIKRNYGWLIVAIIVIIIAVILIFFGYKWHTKTVEDLKQDHYQKHATNLLDDDGADIKPDMETITPQQKIQISTNDDDDDDQ